MPRKPIASDVDDRRHEHRQHAARAARGRRRRGVSRFFDEQRLVEDARRWRCTGSGRCRTGSSPSPGRRSSSRRRARAPATTTTAPSDEQHRRDDGVDGAVPGAATPLRRRARCGAPTRRGACAAHYLARKPASFISCLCVALGLLEPVAELGAGHRGRVEGALLHEVLPVRRLAHLLEQVDVERDLVRRHAAAP